MKITTITRTVSGPNYDNISATALLDEGEDLMEAAIKLDIILKNTLTSIAEAEHREYEFYAEKKEAVGILEAALENARNALPF